MHLKNLQLLNFKNYDSVDFDFNKKINCFVGKNAVGKTNVLDAIYYLSFTKSFVSSADAYNVKIGENFFLIQGNYERKLKDEHLHCGFKKGQKKQIKRNKKDYKKYADHIGQFPLIMISPLDSEIITGGSDLRRKLIDGVISQYDKSYLEALLKYNGALKQRNSLLKQFAKEHNYKADIIEIWDYQLEQYGSIVYQKRKDFIEEYIPFFQKYYDLLTNDQQTVGVRFQSQLDEDNLSSLLKKQIGKDRMLQHTSVGIHKDDLVFTLNDLPIKRLGSQGQQKTLLLALKLAQYQHIFNYSEIKPILLLDDIFDKLDRERVKNLTDIITQDDFGQTFITDTNEERLVDILDMGKDMVKIFNLNKTEV
jgi:DNA replication and repair protein RecF